MITLHCEEKDYHLTVEDSSYRYRAVMAKPQLVLNFSLPEYVEIPVGAWCVLEGQRFVLGAPGTLKKAGTRHFEYSLTLGTDEDKMGLYKMRNTVDGRLKYSLCAKPREMVEEIVKNLNAREGKEVWSVGECIEAGERTLEFNHMYIDDALGQAAELFGTEWEVEEHAVSLRKVEHFKDDPLPLSYGRGNGFVPGVGRTVQEDDMPVKRMYVQGGERNIDRSKYGSAELLLPKGQTLEYEGRTYQSDTAGYYIERADKVSDAVRDDSVDCSEIYPSRVGKVSGVAVADEGKHLYDFTDSSIPEGLDFNDCLIEGERMTVVFQSGMLSGSDKEFEAKYKHGERRFELVPQEIDGQTMPNATFAPAVGDTYAVFGIMLPEAYICDNAAKEGASWDMFREAARKLYECEEQKFTFTGELQGLWAKRNWLAVGGKLKAGGYVLFSDAQFAKQGVAIRITGIKDYVNNPYAPTIELSNSVAGQGLHSKLQEIGKAEVAMDEAKKEIIRFTKRRFRDTLETMGMLEQSLLDFSGAVNPVAVQTMAALIGDESLQFRFVQGRESLLPVQNPVTYSQEGKQLHCPHAFLQHMTLGIRSISGRHAAEEYKVWELEEYLSPVLVDGAKSYYLYAKVSREDTAVKGVFVLSEKPVAMDGAAGVYHLLVGVLNSETGGERSYVSLYGFTEILPGRITTERIVSADGDSYIDLVAGAMKLGDALAYNINGEKKLKLKFLGAEESVIGQWHVKDGILYSQDGTCLLDGRTGHIVTTGLLMKRMLHIDQYNAGEYLKEDGSGFGMYTFDFHKAGTLISVDSLPEGHQSNTHCLLPSIYGSGSYTEAKKNEARAYIGLSVLIYNKLTYAIPVTGAVAEKEDGGFSSFVIQPGSWARLDCKLRRSLERVDGALVETGKEEVYWLRTVGSIT